MAEAAIKYEYEGGNPVQYRKLGNSGLKVSEISLGSWSYGGYVEQDSAVACIQAAYELGINFFDTADIYQQGEAERIVGHALQNYDRSSYVLATKVFGRMGNNPNNQTNRGLSRKHIIEACYASLKRLNLNYIDVFICHRFDVETPIEETLRALDDLITQGDILYAGVSNWSALQMAEAHAIADKYLLDRIIANQPAYNMLNRKIEKEVIPLCESKGIGLFTYAPLEHGMLAGKYKSVTDIPPDSRGAKVEWMRHVIIEKDIAKVLQLTVVAEELNLTVGQLAIAWVLRHPGVASALLGASRPEQLVENAAASGVHLSKEILDRIEAILTES